MKKLGVFLLILVLLIIPTLAQDNPENPLESGVDSAYQCLQGKLDDKEASQISLQEAVFSTLALGSDAKLTEAIESEKANQNCWPKSSCTIKDTAQVFLAYDRIGKSTSGIQDYLATKNQSAAELTWYLQIDIQNHESSSCTIKYDGRDFNVNIGEDMKLSAGAGSCLSRSESGYWLQVSRTGECQEKTYQVSCDKDFITSLLYQKSGSQTIFVSSETSSASSSGTTQEKINSLCFKAGNDCDYEGTLWAALALQTEGQDVASYLPYLLAFAPDNQKLFPSSFLHILTSGDDQYNEIVQSQKSSGFWEAPNTKYNKFYDTALGMLSLQSTSSTELGNAKDYLLSIQTPEGCWNNNNVRDTAFLLYSGWPSQVSREGGGGGTDLSCSTAGYFCGSQFDCIDAQGQVLNQYQCSGFQSCCSVPIAQQSCSEKSGIICPSGQQCSGTEVSSTDGSCCLSACQPAVSESSACEQFGGFCSFSCSSNEKQTPDSCNEPGLICCIAQESSGSGFGAIWIILIVLIILAVLAILFRKKLQILFFRFRNRKSSSPPSSGPRAPPRFMPPPRRGPPIARSPLASRPIRKSMSAVDREMEDTLKKLKEMST